MAAVARTLGRISGIAATVLSLVPGMQPIAAAFAVNSFIMGQLGKSAAPYSGQGAPSDIQIGSNMPSPYAMGDFYSGGSRIAQVAYGTENDVPNAHLWAVDVYSVGGPIEAITQEYADFTALSFSGNAETGYYSNNTLHRDKQLGETNEATALTPNWSGAPDWSSAHKLSGKAAIGWSARYPKDGKRFGGGFPQMGIRGLGVLTYDPRLDSTYPGGSGAHRWADPSDKVAFAAAKATWTYSANPGLHALRYALGTWERDESNSSAEYRKVFGVGGSIDQIVVADFVEHANVCDANGWTVNGVIYEGLGINKLDNLKKILAAGGAETAWKGARLGLKINAPGVPIDTITLADIGEGEPVVPGTIGYEDRKNTLNPYFVSDSHKWESVPSAPVQITDYVTMDGEERPEDFPNDLVTSADQANQLAGYELVNRREQPFSLPLLRRWDAGSLLDLDDAVLDFYGIQQPLAKLMRPSVDFNQMRWAGDFLTETEDKHDYALGLTGTSPPVVTIVSPEETDGAVGAVNDQTATLIATSTQVDLDVTATDTTITISDHIRRYSDVDVDVDGDTLTGLTAETQYHLYYDDPDRAGGAVTYHATEDYFEAFLSAANPRRHYAGFVRTDISGGSGTSGGGSLPPGGGGSSPYEQELIIDGQVPLA